MEHEDHSFHMVGIKGKLIVDNPYSEKNGEGDRGCAEKWEVELQECFDLMSQPRSFCSGMGGNIKWVDTKSETSWKGTWTCKQCGHSHDFSFNPKRMLCVYCENKACANYGYIRISRRL